MTQTQLLVSTTRPGTDHASRTPRYSLLVATEGAEVLAAQRLRYQVFAWEMGARLSGAPPGVDVDAFDAYCDHLVVRDDDSGAIVGTYRMLPPERVSGTGMLYSETEFDLRSIAALRGQLVEAGRACVHPGHRTGAVLSLVWAGIARYLLLSGHSWLAGCASVPLSDGGAQAAAVWQLVRHKHYAPDRYRVRPLRPWDADRVPPARPAVVPPLLRGYLRLGAWVCGPPAHDADFGVADLFVLLGLEQVDQRYLSRFLGARG